MGSASRIQEGTPALPPWHPRSTVFYQLTLYPLVNSSPSLETLVPHHYCGEPPRTHSLHSSFQLDTHKVLVHQKSKRKSPTLTKSPRAALWQVFIGSGVAYSFARSANQLPALYLLYLGFQPLTLLPFLSLIIKKQSLTN